MPFCERECRGVRVPIELLETAWVVLLALGVCFDPLVNVGIYPFLVVMLRDPSIGRFPPFVADFIMAGFENSALLVWGVHHSPRILRVRLGPEE